MKNTPWVINKIKKRTVIKFDSNKQLWKTLLKKNEKLIRIYSLLSNRMRKEYEKDLKYIGNSNKVKF